MSLEDRLLQRFMKHGLDTFEDIEVLELLLGLRLDSKTHRSTARSLLRHYKNLSQIIDASLEERITLRGFKEDYLLGLRLPHEVATRYLREKSRERPVGDSVNSVLDYLKHSMRRLKKEHFKVIFLDSKNRIIADEDLFKGTVNTAPVYPREVLKAALRHDATALVIAHNHLSGDPEPSDMDKRITEQLYNAASLLEIRVYDHIIIADNSFYSFAGAGLISKYRKKYEDS